MSKLRSTIGFVGADGVLLKDHAVFEKGELVVVVSVENFEDFLNEITEIKENIETSKRWINKIKEINGNDIKK